MEDKSFKIEADITFEELHKHNKYRSHSPKFYYITFVVIIMVILCGIIILSLLHKDIRILPEWLFLVLIMPLIIKIDSKNKFKKLKDKKITYTISYNGIRFETADSLPSKIYKWSDFRKVCENEEVFSFFCRYMDNSDFIIIPKRCFAGEAEIQLLGELLERNVRQSRLKIKTIANQGEFYD